MADKNIELLSLIPQCPSIAYCRVIRMKMVTLYFDHTVLCSHCTLVTLYIDHPVHWSPWSLHDHPVHCSPCTWITLYLDHPVYQSPCTLHEFLLDEPILFIISGTYAMSHLPWLAFTMAHHVNDDMDVIYHGWHGY